MSNTTPKYFDTASTITLTTHDLVQLRDLQGTAIYLDQPVVLELYRSWDSNIVIEGIKADGDAIMLGDGETFIEAAAKAEEVLAATLAAEQQQRKTLKHAIHMLFHNMVIHPLAGLCWLFGARQTGDWIHNH